MKLPARIRYATRILLALVGREGWVSLRQLEAEQGISAKFAKQIMQPLERSGLVKSTRGASGGYTLARTPQKISLADIFAAFGETIALAPCTADTPEPCERQRCGCPAAATWTHLNQLLLTHTQNTTLQSLLSQTDSPSPDATETGPEPGDRP